MVQLDAQTGLLGADALAKCGDAFPFCWSLDNEAFINIANRRGYDSPTEGYVDGNAIEASYLYNNVGRTGFYYLFVNWYWCCRGANSTYQVMVGRSTSPTGPFLDKDGVDMTDNGGSVFIANKPGAENGHAFTGPGHAGILYDTESSKYVYTSHFEDVDGTDRMLVAVELTFDGDAWPASSGEPWLPQQGRR